MDKSDQKSSSIHELYISAREFCILSETAHEKSKFDFLSHAQKLLTLIYLKACLLQGSDQIQDGEAEKFVQEEDWSFIQNIIAGKIGSSDRFVEIFLPDNLEPNNIESESLSDCFADVYQDLKNFVSNYEIGNSDAVLVAMIDCLHNFENFWGPRLLSILVALHSIINTNRAIDDDDLDTIRDSETINKSNSNNWIINQRFYR